MGRNREVHLHKNSKTGGNDGLMGELLIIMVDREWFTWLFKVVCQEDADRKDPGIYKGITLLSVVGKVFS